MMHDRLPERGIAVIFVQNEVTRSFNKGFCVQKMNIHEWTQKKVTSVLFLVKCLGLKKHSVLFRIKCLTFWASSKLALVFGLENIRIFVEYLVLVFTRK